jgi:hypothetical protein
MEYPPDCELSWVHSPANNPKYSWNKVVQDFLAVADNDWLFSCHNDICFHPDTLPRLLSWDKPLISALVFMRSGPAMPHIWKSYNDQKIYIMRINDTKTFFGKHPESHKWGPQVLEPRPDDALAEIDFTSTSCTLIHRSVLEAIQAKYGEEWFLMDNDYSGGGEDRRFFERAREVGFPAYVDRSCVAGHITGDVPVGVMDFLAWSSVSTFLGTGEHDNFTVENIQWMSGSQILGNPPQEMIVEAMQKLERGEAVIGDGKLADNFIPLGQQYG